ncbi:MAG: hypothetical protein KVP17_004709 [Porospora cf. gigantea B]|uniref:uncharacterized protein n=1 Tax=Porospora cf. gigantea B TaxID=2853592 RepID=UPI003571D1EF|nr:MAG: hypothetical protein KVP17_004709 [Porospora cf. gigantea B]
MCSEVVPVDNGSNGHSPLAPLTPLQPSVEQILPLGSPLWNSSDQTLVAPLARKRLLSPVALRSPDVMSAKFTEALLDRGVRRCRNDRNVMCALPTKPKSKLPSCLKAVTESVPRETSPQRSFRNVWGRRVCPMPLGAAVLLADHSPGYAPHRSEDDSNSDYCLTVTAVSTERGLSSLSAVSDFLDIDTDSSETSMSTPSPKRVRFRLQPSWHYYSADPEPDVEGPWHYYRVARRPEHNRFQFAPEFRSSRKRVRW